MKIRCDRNELAERLQSIVGTVSATTTKPILQDFHFRATDNELVVEATDLDISARIQLERMEIEEPGQVALQATRIVGLIREIPGTIVSLESVKDEGAAIVKSEGFEVLLLGDDPAEFPTVQPFASDMAFEVHREKFVEMLRRVGIAASRDTSRYQLTGIFVEVEGEKMTMTATDGKRLTHDVMRIENPGGTAVSAIVPNRAIDVMTRVLATGEEKVKLSLLETEIQLSFGCGQLMAKLIEGAYPDFQTAMPKEKRTKISAKRTDLLAAVRSASLVTDRETATVLFRFDENGAHLESRGSEIGESKIEVPISFEGEDVAVRFNPVYFIDALRTVNEELIRMEFCGSDRPGTIRGGVHYRHMLMPLVVG